MAVAHETDLAFGVGVPFGPEVTVQTEVLIIWHRAGTVRPEKAVIANFPWT